MTKHPNRIWTCARKVRFVTFHRAEEVASKYEHCRAYHCPICQGYHVGGLHKEERAQKQAIKQEAPAPKKKASEATASEHATTLIKEHGGALNHGVVVDWIEQDLDPPKHRSGKPESCLHHADLIAWAQMQGFEVTRVFEDVGKRPRWLCEIEVKGVGRAVARAKRKKPACRKAAYALLEHLREEVGSG